MIKKISGNPIPLLIGSAVGFYIADRDKGSSIEKKILFTVAGGLIVSVAFIMLLDKGGKIGRGIEINPELPPVQGVKQS